MRWFTCTPKDFIGNESFFARDSGLTCRGFQGLGVESRAICLGPPREDDLDILIRATLAELESPQWWEKQRLDGVVFYSWINPSYLPIANAIKTAGIKLVQVADTHGVVSPLADWSAHLRSAWSHQWQENTLRKIIRTALKLPYTHTLGILRDDIPMVSMINAGDYFLAATPGAATRFRRMARRLGGEVAAEKVRMIPLPVSSHFRFEAGDNKADEVISVGRWSHPQKRQHLLMETLENAAGQREITVFRIFGEITPELRLWHSSLPDGHQSRIRLEGLVPNANLAIAYSRARVMLVTAAYEGCHNASAEALCSGCSIVSPSNPFLCALDWHTSDGSGRTIPDNGSGADLATALTEELAAWDTNFRDPSGISEQWTAVFHPESVAKEIMKIVTPEIR